MRNWAKRPKKKIKKIKMKGSSSALLLFSIMILMISSSSQDSSFKGIVFYKFLFSFICFRRRSVWLPWKYNYREAFESVRLPSYNLYTVFFFFFKALDTLEIKFESLHFLILCFLWWYCGSMWWSEGIGVSKQFYSRKRTVNLGFVWR